MNPQRNIATDRFGLGVQAVEVVPDDLRGWLREQLRRFDPAPPVLAAYPDSAAIGGAYADLVRIRRSARGEGGDAEAARAMGMAARQEDARLLAEAAATRIEMAVASETSFAERLVHFWSNHFAVSVEKLPLRIYAADYEFRVIRPNIMGSFTDLLLSVAAHPAMLIFLDQTRSVGPGSALAVRANRRRSDREIGLNENYAREILELHTLGVRSGYGQEDVTELARALTGWTVAGVGDGRLARFVDAADGETVFVEELHEPGRRTVLGRTYADSGAEQAPAILRDLAMRPETAAHIARKLAVHFIADDPPAAAVTRLAQAFLASDGDLPSVYAALIDEPEVWSAPRAKFRSPWDWLVASLRVTGIAGAGDNLRGSIRAFGALGQPVWQPGHPAGWSDQMVDWASPGALLARVELANRFAPRAGRQGDLPALATHVLGDALRSATADAIMAAEASGTRGTGLALLLSSPEFMRR